MKFAACASTVYEAIWEIPVYMSFLVKEASHV
jgi:hypothetical protein